MAFGITRSELQAWKQDVAAGKIAFLTHFWTDERFPGCYTVTKVGCRNLSMLIEWGAQHDLQPHWIHERDHFPHFDLFGDRQLDMLMKEGQWSHIEKFKLTRVDQTLKDS